MYRRNPFGMRLFVFGFYTGFRAVPNKWNLYAQIQCLLRLIPRFFTVFSVGLLKHFSLPLLKFLHLKNPCTEN